MRKLALALLLLAPAGAAAGQTIYGPGGLFIHPTAFVPPARQVGLNISWFRQNEVAGQSAEFLPVSLTYQPISRLQLGGLYLHKKSGKDENLNAGGVFAKLQILGDSPSHVAFAVAGSFLAGDMHYGSVTGVASYRFLGGGGSTAFIGHVGLQWVHHRPDERAGPAGDSEDGISIYGGGEVPISRRLSLVGEIGSRLDFDPRPSSAIGLMWRLKGGLTLGVAAVNIGTSRDSNFFVGAGYGLGGLR